MLNLVFTTLLCFRVENVTYLTLRTVIFWSKEENDTSSEKKVFEIYVEGYTCVLHIIIKVCKS